MGRHCANILAYGTNQYVQLQQEKIAILGADTTGQLLGATAACYGVGTIHTYDNTRIDDSLLNTLTQNTKNTRAKNWQQSIRTLFSDVNIQSIQSLPHQVLLEKNQYTHIIQTNTIDKQTFAQQNNITYTILKPDILEQTLLNCAHVIEKKPLVELPAYQKKKISAAIIGCGGIGMYVALCLAKQGCSLDLYDQDTVEQSNLNRQFLYGNKLSQNKAKALATILRRIQPDIRAHPYAIQKDSAQHLKKNDVVYACTDSFSSRRLLSDFCFTHDIPLIEGACNEESASITQFLPHKTDSIAKQRKISHIQDEKQSCATKHASVIFPNMIAGAVMAATPLGTVQPMTIYTNGRFIQL